jgi:hypothetical protein
MQILSLIYNMDSSQSPLDDPSPDTSPHVPATPPPFFAHQAGDYEQSTGFYSAGPPAFLVHDHDEDEDEDTSGENVGFASLENSNLDYTTRDYLPPTRDYHSNRGYSPAPPSREYTPSPHHLHIYDNRPVPFLQHRDKLGNLIFQATSGLSK